MDTVNTGYTVHAGDKVFHVGSTQEMIDFMNLINAQTAELDALRVQVKTLEYENGSLKDDIDGFMQASMSSQVFRHADRETIAALVEERDQLRKERDDYYNEMMQSALDVLIASRERDEARAELKQLNEAVQQVRHVLRQTTHSAARKAVLIIDNALPAPSTDDTDSAPAPDDVLYTLVATSVHEPGWPEDRRGWYELRDKAGRVCGAGYTPRVALEDLEFEFEAPKPLDDNSVAQTEHD